MSVSIIVPVYKVEEYLRRCVDSLLSQTYDDLEIILVDDGSPDGCPAICDEYKEKDDRIKVVHQKNGGASAARNSALEAACGEWVTFVDSDDSITPEWFAHAVALMTDDVDLVRLAPIGCLNWPHEPTSVLRGQDAVRWAWRMFSEYGYLWLCFVRRTCIGNVRFRLDVPPKEDMLFLLEVTPALRSVVQGDFAGYNYRPVEESASRKKRSVSYCVAFLTACLDIWRSQRAWVEELEIVDFVRKRWRVIADNDILQWIERPGEGDPREIRRAYRALEREGVLAPGYCERRLVLVWRWTRCFWLYRLVLTFIKKRIKAKEVRI